MVAIAAEIDNPAFIDVRFRLIYYVTVVIYVLISFFIDDLETVEVEMQ
jgi:hypothetical protein